MDQRDRFQFSMRWLFVFTTVAAVVAALVSRIQAPRLAVAIIGTYFIVWAIYLTFNLVRMARVIADSRQRLRQIRLRREVGATPRRDDQEGTRT